MQRQVGKREVLVYLAAMNRALVHRLADQAMECRKLAWSMGDQRACLLLHEMASECELRAIQAARRLQAPVGRPSAIGVQPERLGS